MEVKEGPSELGSEEANGNMPRPETGRGRGRPRRAPGGRAPKWHLLEI